MSFSLSGSVITQSGTDTSLAGLVGIAGVTTVGTGDKVTYVFASRQLVITGSLAFDPEKESLEFDENCTSAQLTVSGASAVLTIGATGKGRPWPVMAVYCRKREVNWSTRQVYVHTGGVLRHYYGVIHCQGAVEILSTAGYCTFGGLMHFSLTQYADQYGRFYPGRSAEYLSTFTVSGNGVQPLGASTVSNLTIADGRTIGLHGASYGSLASPYEVRGVTLINASVYPWAESVWSLIGMAAGGNVVKTGGGVSAGTRQLIRTYGLANVTVTAAGTAVVGARVFSRDTNNGSRSSFSCGTPAATYDGVPDTTNIVTTGSGGTTGAVAYLLQAWSRNSSAVVVTDWRTLTPGQNTRQINVKGYTIKPVGAVLDMTDAGTLQQPVFAEVDTAVSLSEAAAGALTTLTTLDDLYDAAKHWSVQDANLEYPTAATQPITSSGSSVDLGDLDLVIDASAGVAFAINTGTGVCTVKASALAAGAKHTRLTTTGTVSTANGATITAIYTDASGTSAVLTLTGLQDASVLLVDGTGATVEFQAAQSGEFDYVYDFAPGAAGTWKWVAKAPGREHATGTFTPGTGGAFTYAPVLVPKLTPSGDPMYTGTTSALVAVSISGTTNAYIDIGDGTAPLQETFNETELALVTQVGMEWLAAGKDDVSIFDSGSGDYLFLTAGWRLRRASAGDANAAIEAYVTSVDGVIVDDTNGPVLYLTSNTPAAIAAAVWAYIDRELTQAIPTAVQNAAAVRTELATELARLDVAVSTRATPVTVPTAAQNADALLGRNLAGGSDGGRTVRDALRASRNKSAISGSTLTVYQEDDATPAWTAAVSTAERDALQSIDPA